MGQVVNFADPEFEPTDEQLHQLSREAFADVARLHAEALVRLRQEIQVLRAQRLAQHQAMDPSMSDTPSGSEASRAKPRTGTG
jgi:hypothetical protein